MANDTPDEVLDRMRENPLGDYDLDDYRQVLEDGEGFDRVETDSHEVYTHAALPVATSVCVPKDRHQRKRDHTPTRTVVAVELVRERA